MVQSCRLYETEIARLEDQNSRIANEVERYQEHEQILKRIETLKHKRAWVVYNTARDTYFSYRDRRKELLQELDNHDQDNVPMKMEIEELSNQLKELKRKRESNSQKYLAVETTLRDQKKTLTLNVRLS